MINILFFLRIALFLYFQARILLLKLLFNLIITVKFDVEVRMGAITKTQLNR